MDSLYFPAFLVAMAVFVIWLYHRSNRAMKKDADNGSLRSPKRRAAARGKQATFSHTARHTPAAGSTRAPNKIWANRRRHASHHVAGKDTPNEDSRYVLANKVGPYSGASAGGSSDNSVMDQEVPVADHVGFDEYLAQQRASAAKSDAGDAGEFTMSAIKFEQTESELEEEEAEKKRSGFKP